MLRFLRSKKQDHYVKKNVANREQIQACLCYAEV